MSKSKNQRNRSRTAPQKPNADRPLNGPDTSFDEKQRELEGRRPPEQQGDAYIQASDTDDLGDITSTDIYQGELEAGVNDDLPNDPDDLELLTERELRDGETSDPFEAIQEGFTYVPPTDPPITPGGEDDLDNAQVAAGMSFSSLEHPYDQDSHSDFDLDEDELSARVRDALRADSMTTNYADEVTIITRGNQVILRGDVDDLTDSDNMAAVAQYVEGVDEVIDELRIRM